MYKETNIAPVKRNAYEVNFKLKAISHAVEDGNRAAGREFNINKSIVWKWRMQNDDLPQEDKNRSRICKGTKLNGHS